MKIPPDSLIAVFLASFGILLCLTVGVQLLGRKDGMKQANLLLGLLLILYGLTLLNSMLAMTGVYATYQYLYFLPLSYSLSIAPLFYFFVKSRISPEFIFKRKDLIHFIFPAIQCLFYFAIGFRSAEFKSWTWRNIVAPYGQYIEESLLVILTIGYLLASLRLLKKELPKAKWKHPVCIWLRKFSIALLVLMSISFIYEAVDWVLWSQFEYNLFNTAWADFPLKLSYALISFFIGYNAFIYQNQSLVAPIIYTESNNSNISTRIDELLKGEQAYLDPELNLDSFSKMLDIHKNKLSSFFSSNGESFRLVVNRHRLEYFLGEIEKGKHEHFSLLGLAFQSGFNSKASFNRIFKELKGKTPREYIQLME